MQDERVQVFYFVFYILPVCASTFTHLAALSFVCVYELSYCTLQFAVAAFAIFFLKIHVAKQIMP